MGSKTKHRGQKQIIMLDAQTSSVMKGQSRKNYEHLSNLFGVEIQGTDTLSISHANAETLAAFVGFFKDTLLPKALEINEAAKEAAENKAQYRPTIKELNTFSDFVEVASKNYIATMCQTAIKAQRGQLGGQLSAKQKNAAANTNSPSGAPLNANGANNAKGNPKSVGFKLQPLEFRGPKDGRKQRALFNAITDRTTDLVFSLGKSGSGKTYTSLAAALQMLEDQRIEKIYIIRPYVPSGRHRMGDVPGNEAKKLRGLMSGVVNNVDQLLGKDSGASFDTLSQKGLIELQPLDKIRSMSFHNCVVLITEAQNVDYDQSDIMMRIGDNCTFIMDGSFEQKDTIVAYPALVDWAIRYADDAETPFVFFNEKDDVVRSARSARHVDALEKSMPAGYQDIRALTPEFTRNAGMAEAIKTNTSLAQKLVKKASERTLDQYGTPAGQGASTNVLIKRARP